MDDHLDIGDRPVGGPHPHAGFETVTLLLQGSIYDRDEGGFIDTGEVQWMTAGRGIIHGENVGTKGKVRLHQLWLTLPKADRWTEPGFQTIHTDAVPVRMRDKVREVSHVYVPPGDRRKRLARDGRRQWRESRYFERGSLVLCRGASLVNNPFGWVLAERSHDGWPE